LRAVSSSWGLAASLALVSVGISHSTTLDLRVHLDFLQHLVTCFPRNSELLLTLQRYRGVTFMFTTSIQSSCCDCDIATDADLCTARQCSACKGRNTQRVFLQQDSQVSLSNRVDSTRIPPPRCNLVRSHRYSLLVPRATRQLATSKSCLLVNGHNLYVGVEVVVSKRAARLAL
jgi:hypothetical protein